MLREQMKEMATIQDELKQAQATSRTKDKQVEEMTRLLKEKTESQATRPPPSNNVGASLNQGSPSKSHRRCHRCNQTGHVRCDCTARISLETGRSMSGSASHGSGPQKGATMSQEPQQAEQPRQQLFPPSTAPVRPSITETDGHFLSVSAFRPAETLAGTPAAPPPWKPKNRGKGSVKRPVPRGVPDSDEWIFASASCSHVTYDSRGMYNCYSPPPGKEHVASIGGHLSKVEFYGSLDLVFHSSEDVKVALVDVAFVPEWQFHLLASRFALADSSWSADTTGYHLLGGRLFFPDDGSVLSYLNATRTRHGSTAGGYPISQASTSQQQQPLPSPEEKVQIL